MTQYANIRRFIQEMEAAVTEALHYDLLTDERRVARTLRAIRNDLATLTDLLETHEPLGPSSD